MPEAHAHRANCLRCLRAQRTCICGLAVPIRHATEVLILQHPLETHQAKGSARLLHLCLPQSLIMVGEQFDASTLHALLYDPWPHMPGEVQGRAPAQPVLLYPSTADRAPLNVAAVQAPRADATVPTRLVLLDGTWRKSRKMLHLNPLLSTLPRMSLSDFPASRYTIRKAHRPEQLSTLEAAYHALLQLERDPERLHPLLHAFTRFVERQMHYAHAAAARGGID